MSRRDYVPVPGFPELRVCVRPYAPHDRTLSLCYVGPMSELIAAGVANLDMLTTAKSGFDAAGDHYTTDAHWSAQGRGLEPRYRIWRKMKRARAQQMPGAREALAHAGHQRQRSERTSANPSSAARPFQNRSGARS